MNSRSTLRVFLERALLVLGLAGAGVWIASVAVPSVWQGWEKWAFDKQVRGEDANITSYLKERVGLSEKAPEPEPEPPKTSAEAPVQRRVAPKTRQLIGRMSIPRLGVDTIVREGSDDGTLTLAAGHIPGTALPGYRGNVAVAGHRDTVFRRLADIRMKDQIRFETLDGNFSYEVSSVSVVKPKNVEVLNAGAYPELTLVTCFPFEYVGSAPERFIVKARLVSKPLEDQPQLAAAPATRLTRPASTPAKRPGTPGATRFEISKGRSVQLAPGISLGVSDTYPAARTVDGWLWVMPERRTIWLHRQSAGESLVFYKDGRPHELQVTAISSSGIAGYLRKQTVRRTSGS